MPVDRPESAAADDLRRPATPTSRVDGENPAGADPRRGRARLSGWFGRFGWVGLIVAAGTLARVPRLTLSLMDEKPFRATQTAFPIRWMAAHSLNPLHAHIPILGPPWTVPMEFPLFQAVAAVTVRAGLSVTVAGRLLALVCFQITAILLFLLVRRAASRRAAFVALVLFEAVPYGALFGTVPLIEFMATAFALGSILCVWRWFDGGRSAWLLAAALVSAGAFTVKITTAAPWALPVAALAWLTLRVDWRGRWRRVLVGLVAAPGFGLAMGLWWTHYADAQKARNPYTQFLISSHLTRWNFGTVGQRLDVDAEGRILRWATEMITGLWPVLVLAVVLVLIARRNRLLKLSVLLVPVLAVQTFFNLYHHNDYYLSAVFPALVAVVAFGFDEAADRLGDIRPWAAPAVAGLAVVTVLATTWPTGLGGGIVERLQSRRAIPDLSVAIRDHTPATANILFVGCNYSSHYLYYANRQGLMYAPHDPGYGGRPAPPLRADNILANYGYVADCGRPGAIRQVPAQIDLQRVAPRLFRIVGAQS